MTTYHHPPTPTQRRILVVDDHPILRKGLTQLINVEKDIRVCGEAADAPEAYRLLRTAKPDLLILEIALRGVHGVDFIRQLREEGNTTPVLVLSMHDEVLYAERVLRAGAQGYIMKDEGDVVILEAIRRILSGEVYLSKEMESRLIEIMVGKRTASGGVRLANLSDRELEVFRMIGQGLGTRQIAEKLFLSIKTVETYRAKIKMKLHLENGSQLVQQAVLWSHPELQPAGGGALVREAPREKTEAAR